MEAHGLKDQEWEISESALRELIRYYTRESGVRNLERELANLTRKAVKEIMSGETKSVRVTRRTLETFAGVKRFQYGEAEAEDLVGVTTGLAWTEVGGELLSIEAVMVPGKGRIIITGKLGDVMQESVQAAKSYVQSRAIQFGVPPTTFAKKDIHVHVPEGATPKDGPSAGVAMVTSIVSVMTGVAVHKDVAMTGEITLRGRVLRIGGLKEKLLAAHRGGLRRVLIPKDNEPELSEIPDNIKRVLEIVPVATVDEVLANALISELLPIEWDEKAELEAAIAASRVEEDEVPGVITH
jgi:ATP-dependent Lon protease